MRYLVVLMALLVVNTSVMAGDEDAILGRWDLDKKDSYYLRFYSDNVVRIGSPGGVREGVYTILGDGVIELITKEASGVKRRERKYRINGDTLELQIGVKWQKYKRAKAE